MSWSIALIGTTTKVSEALTAYSGSLEGQSKQEYDAALPHLVGIVEQNFEKNTLEPIIKLAANGHGYGADGTQISNNLTVSVERFYGKIVI